MFRPVYTFKNLNLAIFVCLTDCQPAVRPGCANAMAPVYSHNKGNCVRFTKLLFQRMSIHYAMVVPFILY